MRIAGNAANLLDSTPACSNIVRMSERPFPKPPAADPLPLEIWLDQTDRSEVGREPFFRGRDPGRVRGIRFHGRAGTPGGLGEPARRVVQGWPQHINSVAVAATGEAYKREHYAGRLEAASGRYWIYRDLVLAAERNGGVLSWDGIHSLTGKVRDGTGESMEDFLTDALHAGLLAPAPELPDHYRIPIPSLGDYLRALPAAPA